MVEESRLSLLGAPVWQERGRSVLLKPSKPHALAAILAAQAGHVVPRSQLLLLLWEDLSEAEGRRVLSTTLTRLRKAWPDMPIRSEGAYLIWEAPASAASDTWLFDRHMQADAPEAALALWRGPFMEGFDIAIGSPYDSWLEQERRRWTRRAMEALDRLAEDAQASQRWDALLQYAEKALALEPFEEKFMRYWLLAQQARGQRAAALARFQHYRQWLERELGVAPEPETLRIAAALAGSPATVTPAPPAPEPSEPPSTPSFDGAAMVGSARFPLVGRKQPLAQLEQNLDPAQAGDRRLVVVRGPMGIGKTRLVQALFEDPSALPARFASLLVGHCYETAAELPYGPLVEAVHRLALGGSDPRRGLPPEHAQQLALLLPGLSAREDVPPPGDDGGGRLRLWEALVEMLARLPQPALFIIEDLQWADHATLQFLLYLLRHPRAQGLRVLATLRTDEGSDAAEDLLWQLEYENRALQIALDPLSPDETAALAAAAGLGHPEAATLFTETGGNPLFAILWAQSLAQARDAGVGEPPAPSTRASVPATIRRIILAQLRRLPPTAQELVRAAAIFPRPVSLPAIAAAAELDADRLVDALESAGRLGFLHEMEAAPQPLTPSGSLIAFSHDLLRRAVGQDIAPARLTLLHRRAFRYWAEMAETTPQAVPLAAMESLAYHAAEGGLAAEAVEWGLRAADGAQAVFAYTDAARFLQGVLANLRSMPPTLERFRLGIDVRLRLTEMGLSIRPAELEDWVAQASDSARALDDHQRSVEAQTLQAITLGVQGRLGLGIDILHKLVQLTRRLGNRTLFALSLMYWGQLLALRGDYVQSAQTLEEAIPLLDALDRVLDAAYCRCTWATVVSALGRDREAQPVLREVAADGLRRNNWAMSAYANDHLAVTAHLHGRWSDALAASDEAITLARRSNQRLHEYVARVFQGMPLARTASLAEGIRAQEAAIAFGTRFRMRMLLDRAYAILAMLKVEAGDLEGAKQAALTGLDIARNDGYRMGVAVNLKVLGQIQAAQGDGNAATVLAEALHHFRTLQVVPEIGRCHAALAALATAPTERAWRIGEARAIFSSLAMPDDLARLDDLSGAPKRRQQSQMVW